MPDKLKSELVNMPYIHFISCLYINVFVNGIAGLLLFFFTSIIGNKQ